MSDLEEFIKEIESVIASEDSLPLDVRGSYVIGATLRRDWELYESNTIVQSIESYASDLEIGNGDEEYLAKAWEEIKRLTNYLKNKETK